MKCEKRNPKFMKKVHELSMNRMDRYWIGTGSHKEKINTPSAKPDMIKQGKKNGNLQ